MFWRVAGFTQPSPIETILDKENFTLEELLDEDDLIQVASAQPSACDIELEDIAVVCFASEMLASYWSQRACQRAAACCLDIGCMCPASSSCRADDGSSRPKPRHSPVH